MKKIAFIDKCVEKPDDLDDSADQQRFRENTSLVDILRRHYKVVTYERLCGKTCAAMRKAVESYSGIITHVPGDPNYPDRIRSMGQGFLDLPQEERTRIFYATSLALIENLHEIFPRTVIIAYTGAGEEVLPDERLESRGVRYVLRRGQRTPWGLPSKFDASQILDWLGAEDVGV